MRVDGFVLAGGLSSRMGEDKSLMRLRGHTLVEISLEKLRSLCGTGRVLCGSTARAELFRDFAETVPDLQPGRGPLGGLIAAMNASEAQFVVVLPVDLPFLPEEVLRDWVMRALAKNAIVSCFRADGHVQPLPVLAQRTVLPVLQAELQAGRSRLRPALEVAAEGDGFLITDAGAIHPAASAWFRNLNTPEDFRLAEAESAAAGK